VTADIARDLAAAGGMADMDGILQLEFSDELSKVVGIGIQVVAIPGLARAAMAAAIMGDTAIAREARKNIWSSKASALSGQPWLKTTGCPLPQSL
jgi:hypothetical protein